MPVEPNKVFIRSAVNDDLDVIVDFNARLASETEGLVLDRATLTEGVRAVLNNESKGRYFVAAIDVNAVGVLMVTYEWSDWRNGQIWWIQSVYVDPEWRRRGVFRALYQYVHQLAKTNNVKGLRLYVERNNTTAHKTYRQMGMTESHYRIFERIPPD